MLLKVWPNYELLGGPQASLPPSSFGLTALQGRGQCADIWGLMPRAPGSPDSPFAAQLSFPFLPCALGQEPRPCGLGGRGTPGCLGPLLAGVALHGRTSVESRRQSPPSRHGGVADLAT